MQTNNKTIWYVSIGVAIVLVFAAGIFLGFRLRTNVYVNNVADIFTPSSDTPPELLAEVYALLAANQYEFDTHSPETLSVGAVNGLLDSLGERFTTYLSPNSANDFRDSLSGEFGGVGIVLAEIRGDTGSFLVLETFDDAPASRAGILAQDGIVAVDGTSVLELSLAEFVELVRGPLGSEVLLTVERTVEAQSNTENLDFLVTRENIKIDLVNHTLSEDGRYALVNINSFSTGVYNELVETLCAVSGSGICEPDMCPDSGCMSVDGVVVDLRGNPGGFVNEVIRSVALFLPNENPTLIAYEVNTNGTRSDWFSTPDEINFSHLPIAVLVDAGSASGSEVFAGSLSDHGLATVIGVTTVGKGSVNQLFELSNGGAINIAVARWFRPCGTLIEGEGIAPDIVLDNETLYNQELVFGEAIDAINTNTTTPSCDLG